MKIVKLLVVLCIMCFSVPNVWADYSVDFNAPVLFAQAGLVNPIPLCACYSDSGCPSGKCCYNAGQSNAYCGDCQCITCPPGPQGLR